MRYGLFLSIFFLISSTLYAQEDTMNQIKPPIAKVMSHADTLHQDVRVDHYFWLRDRNDPQVIAYLEAENKYTQAKMKHTADLQKNLYDEMLARIEETDLSVPIKMDNYYYYYWRIEEGWQYHIYCRKEGSLEAKEEILLDTNQLAEGHDYFDVGIVRTTPDHQLLAYGIDTEGAEFYTIYVKNLTTGELLTDTIEMTDGYIEWANDNQTLFYTKSDEALRPYQVYRHKLGMETNQDVMLYQEDDQAFFIHIRKSKSRKYIILDSGSKTTSEIHYLDADQPTSTFQVLQPRQKDMKYYAYHHDQYFYILTNDNAPNYKLMKVDVSNPSKDHWQEVVAHRDSVVLERIEPFVNHLVLTEREKGLRRLRVIDLKYDKEHYIRFPEPAYSCWLTGNREFNTEILRFLYMSLTTPQSIFDYHLVTKENTLKKQTKVLGDYHPTNYQTERIFATADDGTEIPISLVYRKDMKNESGNPLYLTGYGAYEDCNDPYFSSNRLSLLNRGFIYATANIRGGGEMGRTWYDQGKLLNKKNTFTDFIDCAQYLIDEGYTTADRLVVSGGSAGGLLIGAVLNMQPELFEIAVADVPFVDILNTMLDPTIPLTITEYDEWGNPNEKEYYDYIKSYSPYDNVKKQDYPHLLVTAGLNDSRVGYWEAAKWVAKLRVNKTDENILFLKTNMGAGHGGLSGRYDYLKEIAFEYAFIIDLLGIKE